MENQTVVTLKQGEGRYFASGGLWIYDNEIGTITGRFKNGSVVAVQDAAGRALGKGFINQNSKIRVRMLTRNPEQEINEDFLRFRVRSAWDYRKSVLRSTHPSPVSPEAERILRVGLGNLGIEYRDVSACRIIFGEADFLPGLVVDKYSDVLVVQCLALGMEAFKETLVELVKQTLLEDGIVIRQRNERKPGILCRAHNGGRRLRAVRINGMGMQVKRLHRGSSSL